MSSRFLVPREFKNCTSFLDSLDVTRARRNVKRTLENLQAGDVKLTTEDLADIAQLLKKYSMEDE